MAGRNVRVRLTTVGDQAFRLGENGVVQEYVPSGETLFEGPLNVLMFGTTPYFGYGLKILPFASRYPSMFQVRVAHMHVMRALSILPSIWKGSYFGPLISDFAVEKVRLSFERPVPYQVGGDAAGMRKDITLSVTAQPVRIIRLI
jgi:diacylglycerol kinase family enzyme